jgi:hyperosmotically inducible protein
VRHASPAQQIAIRIGRQSLNYSRVERKLRFQSQKKHAIPYYGVFDWLDGQVNSDGTVVLRGQVVRPTTKSDAEARVKRIPGVTRVDNQIEVLPLSPNDERLRAQIYRTIFNSNSPLFRYGTMAVPPIHIIVKNGKATLKGVVDNKGDANLAYIRTRGVPGLFDVSNELTVGSPDAEAR